MPKSQLVRVFWHDQDANFDTPAFHWTREECRAKKNILGRFISSGCAFQLNARQPRLYPVTAADLHASNEVLFGSTISQAELLANVGIAGGPEEPAPDHVVRRARTKIRLYQRIRDRQAVLGVGRWYVSERIQVSAIQ